ncbi:ABC transporter ATP-binding protein [Mycoplasma sp. Ms02]|uniref:ABC transporter ATP-binding protein n=1 Tax=Mycoplasma sp. Ms02 TaxID=353851 RepID=UPI001C8A95CA|nr:ABC transporter ATP-binding protein [Mycoplasma sp. Ms02]QZE12520.1 ABC transporter ATP-binding protein/permease [Mycoplasma sp. Ms02]
MSHSHLKGTKSDFFRFFKFIFSLNKVTFTLAIFCVILTAAVQSYATLFFANTFLGGYLSDYLESLSQGKPFFDWKSFNVAITIIGVLFTSAVVANILSQKLMILVTNKTVENFRNRLYLHMQQLPLQFFDGSSKGDLISRYTNDIEVMKNTVQQSFPQVISSFFAIVFNLVMMSITSWFLTIVLVALTFTMVLISMLVTKNLGKMFVTKQITIGKLNGYLTEIIDGSKVVKTFNYEQRAYERFKEISQTLYKQDYHSLKWANIIMPLMINLGSVNYIVIAVMGGLILASGVPQNADLSATIQALSKPAGWRSDLGINIGSLAAFLMFSRSFSGPFGQIAQQVNTVMQGTAGASRVYKIMDLPIHEDHGYIELVHESELNETEKQNLVPSDYYWKIKKDQQKTIFKVVEGHIKFDHVCFGYTPKKMIIEDLNLDVKQGQKVALVGSTGAGKTTIVNLLNRFYEVSKGAIYFDDINIKDIKIDHLRRAYGLVLQDTSLFTASIAENIAYGLDSVQESVVRNAARIANAADFIEMMSFGYETIAEEAGEKLSQGQRQLLSIARTSAINPHVLILDEATSTVDTQTEQKIQLALQELLKNKTAFIIAHRLSTIKNSDVIVVLEHGKIIEKGTHADLIKNHSFYYRLYTGKEELS